VPAFVLQMKRQAKPLGEIEMDNGENEMSDLLSRQMTQLTVIK
jgi:hypothetical protein